MWRIRHTRKICQRLENGLPYTDVVSQLYAREKVIAWSRDQNIAIRCEKVDFLQFWFLFLVPGLSTRPLTRWIESTKVQATLHPLSAVCACLPCVVVLPKCYLVSWLWISTAPLGYFGHLFASGTKNGSSQQTSNVKWSFYVFYLPTSYVTSTKTCSQGRYRCSHLIYSSCKTHLFQTSSIRLRHYPRYYRLDRSGLHRIWNLTCLLRKP